jgi:hypothetical protein
MSLFAFIFSSYFFHKPNILKLKSLNLFSNTCVSLHITVAGSCAMHCGILLAALGRWFEKNGEKIL